LAHKHETLFEKQLKQKSLESVDQMVEHLPSQLKALSSNPSRRKKGRKRGRERGRGEGRGMDGGVRGEEGRKGKPKC
jgi:hypothetical protein